MNIAKHIDKFTTDELKQMAQWLEYNPGGPYRPQYGNVGLVAFVSVDELLCIYDEWCFLHSEEFGVIIHKKLKEIKDTIG